MQQTIELEGPDETLSLSALLEALHRKGSRVPMHVAVYITHELARCLRHIHQTEGRAHGAMQAGNVLLLRSGRVRLIDRKAPGLPDPHADVLGLGRMAWEMLVGWPLEEGGGPRPRPVPLAPSLLRAGLPRPVDDLVLRALDRDPRRRYPGPQGLAADCARFLATRPDPRRGLRLLLNQLFSGAPPLPEDAADTRLTAVPWRDGETTTAPPPPLPPPSPSLSAFRPKEPRRWWRPWMSRMALRVVETLIASLLALLALKALSAPAPAQPEAGGRPATVIVPMAR